jgi:hypothetical protein
MELLQECKIIRRTYGRKNFGTISRHLDDLTELEGPLMNTINRKGKGQIIAENQTAYKKVSNAKCWLEHESDE